MGLKQSKSKNNQDETKETIQDTMESRKKRHLDSCEMHAELDKNENKRLSHRAKMELLSFGYMRSFINSISMEIDWNLYDVITQYISDVDMDTKILRCTEIDYVKSLFPNEYVIEFKLLYRALRDGFDTNTFHELCDNKGPTLCIFHSEYQHVFGGFTELQWKNVGSYDHIDGRGCKMETFLCLLRTPIKKDIDNLPIKWTLVQRWKYRSISNFADHGPVFAWYDFQMKQGCDAKSNLGQYFDLGDPIEWPRDTVSLGGAQDFKIIDYQVFELEFVNKS